MHGAAQRLGLRPATVGQMVRARGVHLQVAEIITEAGLQGDTALWARLTTPILGAIQARPIPLFSPDLVARVQEADLTEDMLESQYHADPNPTTARRWLAALRVQHVQHFDLIRSMELEAAR